jgi:hypothetical protein
MGDYFRHWLDMGKTVKNKPKIFNVNWFRLDDKGNFIWPGYGDNLRVLDWIIDRCEGAKKAVETPIGFVPQVEDINIEGLDITAEIVKELLKPGRDPRDELPPPILRKDVMDIADLKPGMKLKGTVRNVIDFGAFVDIGVHQDGLVHISQIADRFVKHPSEVVKVGDLVEVTVLSVDTAKKRISLSMKRDA